MQSLTMISNIVKQEAGKFEGVSLVNIYLTRLVFLLTFLFVGAEAWTTILFHSGAWSPIPAVAYSVWAAYATLAVLGVIQPLKMLPVLAFQILYKVIWLAIVAFPLWTTDALAGSPAEGMTKAFMWVPLAIAAMPWRYFFRTFILVKRA
jgi:hypothetical protein